MRIRIMTAATLVFALTALPAMGAAPELEAGATFFDNGTCVEADGAEGIAMLDGSCVTTADYDVMYGYENLAEVASSTDPTVSIAEEYNMTPDAPVASEREREFNGVRLGTFREIVYKTRFGYVY